jgi:nucleoside-diphosphate-sugar epimerase
VGRRLAAAAKERGDFQLRLLIESEQQREKVDGLGEIVLGDIREALSIRSAFDGIDTVVHLAANPSTHARWEDLIGPNIEGMHNVFEAAAQAGCRKVVFASSVNAVTGSASKDRPMDEEQPIAPGNLYGATKALGEGVGRVYALQRGLSVLCVRLGGVMSLDSAREHTQHRKANARVPITHEDTSRFFLHCVDDTRVRFGIFHAMSGADKPLMSIDRAKEVLGYQPRHRLDAEGFVETS